MPDWNFESPPPENPSLKDLYKTHDIIIALDKYNFLFEWVVPHLPLVDEDVIRSKIPKEQLKILESIAGEYNNETNGATFYDPLLNLYIKNDARVNNRSCGIEKRIGLLLPRIFPINQKYLRGFEEKLNRHQLNLNRLIMLESGIVELHKNNSIDLY